MIPPNAQRPYQDIVEFMLSKLSDSGVLTDLAPGSVARTMVEATAREFSQMYTQMNAIYDAGFIDTATGASLDQLVALLGITRIDGEAEVAEATLVRDSRISARVIVPEGTQIAAQRIQAEDKVIYTVNDDYELREGETTLVVQMQALPDTANGQTNADIALSADDAKNGTLSQLRPIAGISGLSLVGPSVALGVRESDDGLRKRAKMAIASAGGGTAKALEDALMAIPLVKSVQLRDANDLDENGQPAMAPGELEIVLDTPETNLQTHKASIVQAIEAHKGPGILARVRTTMVQVLSGTLIIRVASGALTGAELIKLVDGCNAVLKAEVEGMDIGGTLVWNRVLAGLMAVKNVADVVIAKSNLGILGQAAAPLEDISLPAFTRLNLGEGVEAVAIAPEEMAVVTLGLVVSAGRVAPPPSELTALANVALAHLASIIEGLNSAGPAPRNVDLNTMIARLAGADGFANAAGLTVSAATIRLNIVDMTERSEVVLTGPATTQAIAAGTLIKLADTPVIFNWEPASP